MGLTNALAAAASGLRIVQAGIDVTAKNIANVDTPGYTQKSLVQTAIGSGDRTLGVHLEGYRREASLLVQGQMRAELPGFGYSQTLSQYYEQIDAMYGAPGSASALDTIYNTFESRLGELISSPQSVSVRTQVLADAQAVADRLNTLGNTVQNLRFQAEQEIDATIDRMTVVLESFARANDRIVAAGGDQFAPVEALDKRDAALDELSTMLDIQVTPSDRGGVNIFTSNGTLLFDDIPTNIQFDGRTTVTPESRYSTDPAERQLGTISMVSSTGFSIDLIADGAIKGGKLGALVTLRDDILVEAQQQLDEFAAALSRTFSDIEVAGTAVTAAPQAGFDLDLSALQSGDVATLQYIDNVGSQTRTVSFVRVDNPSVLPLDDSATARTDDQVFGIDFSGASGTVASQIATALGVNFTVSDQGAGVVRVLDDGVPDLVDIAGFSAVATATQLTGQGTSMPLFIDNGGGSLAFSGSFDGGNQLVGFAQRMAINPDLVADNSRLIVYETAPLTASGDTARPEAFLQRLESASEFSPAAGIGDSTGYRDSVSGFVRQIITYQGANAQTTRDLFDTQDQVVTTLRERFLEDTGVNVDEEMANLISLQNTYAANARVISAIEDMIDTLLRI